MQMIQSRKNKAKEMGFTHSEDKLDAEDHDVPALGTDDDSSVTDDEDLDQSLGIPQSQSLCTIQDAGNILAHQVGLVLAAVLEDDLQNGASALPTKSGVSHHGSLNGEERSTSKVPGSIDLTVFLPVLCATSSYPDHCKSGIDACGLYRRVQRPVQPQNFVHHMGGLNMSSHVSGN